MHNRAAPALLNSGASTFIARPIATRRKSSPRRRRRRCIEDRGMNVHRHPRDDQFGEEGAGKPDNPISSATTITVGVSTPAKANTAILTMPVAMEIAASVAITAVPSSPAARRSDSRTTPAPLVPPTSSAPAGRGEGKTLFAKTVAEVSEEPPQRHGGDQRRTDHDGGATAGQQRVEPGAQHAGRHRRRQARSARRRSSAPGGTPTAARYW